MFWHSDKSFSEKKKSKPRKFVSSSISVTSMLNRNQVDCKKIGDLRFFFVLVDIFQSKWKRLIKMYEEKWEEKVNE